GEREIAALVGGGRAEGGAVVGQGDVVAARVPATAADLVALARRLGLQLRVQLGRRGGRRRRRGGGRRGARRRLAGRRAGRRRRRRHLREGQPPQRRRTGVHANSRPDLVDARVQHH